MDSAHPSLKIPRGAPDLDPTGAVNPTVPTPGAPRPADEALVTAPEVIVLAGLTGTGKSAALAALAAAGERVIDLQSLAAHRGSAFGGFDRRPQPTHQQFQEAVRSALAPGCRSSAGVTWVEDCPRYLGSVGLPQEMLTVLASAAWIELRRDRPDRVAAIVAEYGSASPDQWRAAVHRIRARLGPRRTALVRELLDGGHLADAVDALLEYYDRGYRNGAPPRRTAPITVVGPEVVGDELRALVAREAVAARGPLAPGASGT